MYDVEQDRLDDLDSMEPVVIEFPYGGKSLALKEASGEVAVRYRNIQMRGAILGPNGKPQRLEAVADGDLVLLAGCLFERVKSNDRVMERPCSMTYVKNIPNPIFKRMVAKAKHISDLDQTDDDEETILKQIADLQEKLAKVREGDTGPKDESESTGTGSDSPTNSESPSTNS